MAVEYRNDIVPPVEDIAELYDAADLRRPTADVERIRRMYAGSNLVWSAWSDNRLIGILRGWTDGAYDGYVCDLAVHPDYQNQSVGRSLLDHVRSGRPHVQFVLRASPLAKDYYEHIGWQKIENGWFWPREPW